MGEDKQQERDNDMDTMWKACSAMEEALALLAKRTRQKSVSNACDTLDSGLGPVDKELAQTVRRVGGPPLVAALRNRQRQGNARSPFRIANKNLHRPQRGL